MLIIQPQTPAPAGELTHLIPQVQGQSSNSLGSAESAQEGGRQEAPTSSSCGMVLSKRGHPPSQSHPKVHTSRELHHSVGDVRTAFLRCRMGLGPLVHYVLACPRGRTGNSLHLEVQPAEARPRLRGSPHGGLTEQRNPHSTGREGNCPSGTEGSL